MNLEAKGELLKARTRAYLTEPTESPDFTIQIPDSAFLERHKRFPMLTLDECRYVWTGDAFYDGLLHYDGLLMHSSCIERNGNAYLFSAKSGTGKSTHANLWMQEFKDCRIINDDKPALRKIENRFYAFGTPFSGKNDLSVNVGVPIRALIFIERGEKNSIEKIPAQQAIPLFLSQTIRPVEKERMAGMLDLLSEVLSTIPAFLLKCNMEKEAPHVSFDGVEAYYAALQNGKEE